MAITLTQQDCCISFSEVYQINVATKGGFELQDIFIEMYPMQQAAIFDQLKLVVIGEPKVLKGLKSRILALKT